MKLKSKIRSGQGDPAQYNYLADMPCETALKAK